ncbi:hypothetical protein [Azospirillum picis]|uniref:Quinol:cytochrome c oxidoreductase quinone-binding subunit 2 n=1 Tax=Azospirillum picis TaxID=488438 RepID=A0ABU0MRA4_9PROT|nr:hypothetical protein [Azospirillum picis]MBP2302436.1 hypothetical protein [Azospirillum picis]MDQ0536015.1 hypothetical protein [Azospirillum picis]
MRCRSSLALSLLLAAAGGAACAAGALVDPQAVLRGWLASLAFWIGLPLGAMMLLFAHDLTGGRWGAAAVPPLRAMVAALPLALLLLLPVLVWLPQIYPWARPEEAAHLRNQFYLNTPFFLARAATYAVVWLLLAWAALRRPGTGANPVAAPGLILLGLTGSFAAVDWMMSVEPDWGSSIYGMMIISGQLLGALALATLAAVLGGRPDGGRVDGGRVDPGQRNDLGSLLIAAVLLWFYLSFMQFLIVWQENLPQEITWYVRRLAGGWGWTAVLGALAQGAVPFLALVWWPVKRSRRGLAAVCALLLAAHLMECWWLILPGLEGGFTWFAPAAALAMGGAGAAVFLRRLGRRGAGRAPARAADGHVAAPAALPDGARHG